MHDRAGRRAERSRSVRYGSEVFHAIGAILHERGLPTLVGDEGGYAPPLETPQQALDLIVAAIERAGYHAGKDVAIALDPASSEFYRDGSILSALARSLGERGRHDRALRRAVRTLSDRFDRRRSRRERLGRLAEADAGARQPHPTRRRRSLRDERAVSRARHRGRRRQRDPHQSQSDRHAHRNARLHRDGAEGRLPNA